MLLLSTMSWFDDSFNFTIEGRVTLSSLAPCGLIKQTLYECNGAQIHEREYNKAQWGGFLGVKAIW
jgi:hypothetical protein